MEKVKKIQNKKQQKTLLKTLTLKLDVKKELGLNIKKDKYNIIPIFIPHAGCKNSCIFCNQKKISGNYSDVTPLKVKNIIEENILYFKDKNNISVAFFGGSFTGLSISEMKGFLEVTDEYIKQKKIKSVRISTRPDYIDSNILKFLKLHNVTTIELGVQSLDNDVLNKNKRGHSIQDIENASKLIKSHKIKLGHQIIIGLLGSSIETELATIKKCIKLKPDMIRIYPLYVLPDSELYDMYKNKEYIPLKLSEALKRTKEVYIKCVKAKLNVIRIGLQTTEYINEKNIDIIGPVCDNYKEQILSSIARESLEKKLFKIIKEEKLEKLKELELKLGPKKVYLVVPKNQVGYITGVNKSNIKYFKDTYNIDIFVNKKM